MHLSACDLKTSIMWSAMKGLIGWRSYDWLKVIIMDLWHCSLCVHTCVYACLCLRVSVCIIQGFLFNFHCQSVYIHIILVLWLYHNVRQCTCACNICKSCELRTYSLWCKCWHKPWMTMVKVLWMLFPFWIFLWMLVFSIMQFHVCCSTSV